MSRPREPIWALAVGAALVVLLEIGRVEAGGRDYAWLVGRLLSPASLLNAFVYPYVLPGPSGIWEPVSALMFAVALALTGWLLLTASRRRDYASPS